MLSDKKLHDAILACETQVWKALVSGDRDADDAALHSTFLVSIRTGSRPRQTIWRNWAPDQVCSPTVYRTSTFALLARVMP